MHQLCLFMTPSDEERLGRDLRSLHPAVRFVDSAQQPETPAPTFHTSLSECTGFLVTVVDTSIVSEDEFRERYVIPHPSGQGWIYAMVGTGVASLLRPRLVEGGLQNGELRASLPPDDTVSGDFVDTLMGLARRGGTAVVPYDTATGAVGRRADRMFVAWPEAADRFDGAESGVLINSTTATFVARRPSARGRRPT